MLGRLQGACRHPNMTAGLQQLGNAGKCNSLGRERFVASSSIFTHAVSPPLYYKAERLREDGAPSVCMVAAKMTFAVMMITGALLQVSVSQVACTALSFIGVPCSGLTPGYANPLPGL